ncbi:MAG TPA: 50S ribosomal protein L10, partial [Candidatus Paceibacterota bacterium]|nr:50S ribosomal protein L10 [Candidatus Paceibacterota bacterium]
MAITREKKEAILGKLKDGIAKAQSMVFVNFHGLPVAGATQLRRSLRDNKVGYMVAKKTLIRKAFDGTGIEGEMPVLDGEIAMAYGEDLLAPAKGVYDFQKKNAEAVRIVG